MVKEKSKILIVGKNSYLATDLVFDSNNYFVDKIRRPYEGNEKQNYRNYDFIINFCIQPEHFNRKLDESEMIDVQIAKEIIGTNTKQIFLSSRKVYGSNFKLKEYKETDELKPYDFYSENKVLIEEKLQKVNPNNLLILRTGNIIGEPVKKKNYKTFIGWIEKELEEKGMVNCSILSETRKDFISKKFFQKVLVTTVQNNLSGIYNVGAGFTFSIKEILLNLLPKNLVSFKNAVTESEQFVLNIKNITKYINPFSQKELINECKYIQKIILNQKMADYTKK